MPVIGPREEDGAKRRRERERKVGDAPDLAGAPARRRKHYSHPLARVTEIAIVNTPRKSSLLFSHLYYVSVSPPAIDAREERRRFSLISFSMIIMDESRPPIARAGNSCVL